jgi:hypothetical protein
MDQLARGLLVVDNIRGAFFVSIALVTSLKVGDSRRVLRSLDLADGTEMLPLAGESIASFGARLLDAERIIAGQRNDNEFLGRSLVSAAQKSLAYGQWRAALQQSSEGLTRLNNLSRNTWENNTATMISLRALEELGELKELTRRADAFVAASRARGDFYGLATGSLYAAYGQLSHDDVASARMLAEHVDGMWVGHHFHLQHFYIFRIKTLCDLYAGDVDSALDRLQAFTPLLRASRLRAVPMINMDFNLLAARLKLIRTPGDSCAEEISALAGQTRGASSAYANVIKAVVFARNDDRAAAVDALSKAQQQFGLSGMSLWHAYASIRLNELQADENGAKVARESLAKIAAQGVMRPERWLELHVPRVIAER